VIRYRGESARQRHSTMGVPMVDGRIVEVTGRLRLMPVWMVGGSPVRRERVDGVTQRVVGASFVVPAAYVAVDRPDDALGA
jgi:hypothetical protein